MPFIVPPAAWTSAMCSAFVTFARALEHQVLEQVREAGLAGDLVLGADAVPDVHGDDGREMVLGDDQAQAVGQALVAERDTGRGHRQTPRGLGGWARCAPVGVGRIVGG